jgi:hypothetical protein
MGAAPPVSTHVPRMGGDVFGGIGVGELPRREQDLPVGTLAVDWEGEGRRTSPASWHLSSGLEGEEDLTSQVAPKQ